MFRAKPIATLLVAFIVVGLIWQAVSLWLPPRPSTAGATSWSTQPGGSRALYTLLERLELPVTRSSAPPTTLFSGSRRVVLFTPDLQVLEREKAALAAMEHWLREGGELVVISSELEADWEEIRDYFVEEIPEPLEILMRPDFRKHIGADNIILIGETFEAVEEEEQWDVYGAIRQVLRRVIRPERPYELTAEGSLAFTGQDADAIYLVGNSPNRIEVDDGADVAGELFVLDEDGESVTVAVEYTLGAGSVLLIAEPILFSNAGLGRGDNAVIAARLVAGDGSKAIVLDEFYHGAMPIGQPMVLFGMYPYGIVLLSLLAMASLWAWRQYIAFGPPLADHPPPRRSIVEYIDAMGQLFQRGKKRRFALETCRRGLLEDLRHELHLPHGAGERIIIQRLEHHDSERAATLRDALAQVDGALSAADPPLPRDLVQLQERLEACRISPSPSPKPPPETQTPSANSIGAA
jgi:hypothetical protein